MTHKHTAEVKSHCAQQQVPLQKGTGNIADYKQILNEGYVYDNEDLIAAQPNTAYSNVGQPMYILAPLIHRVVHKSKVTVCSMSCIIACIQGRNYHWGR